MRFFLCLVMIFCLYSCNQKKEGNSNDFLDSFKKLKVDGKIIDEVEHMDSINKIYSNYKYHLSFDGPNNWEFDMGVSQHTIYRTYQPDSILTFTVNVIEYETDIDENSYDIWEVYQKNKGQMDKHLIDLIEYQSKSKIENFESSKVFIKNKGLLRRSFKYVVRDLNSEYYLTHIVLQTFSDNITFSFSLSVPTVYYDNNTDYYENIFRGIYFLKDTEKLNELMKKHN